MHQNDVQIALTKHHKESDSYMHMSYIYDHHDEYYSTLVDFEPLSVLERRKTCVKFIKTFRKCSVPEAVLRFFIQRKSSEAKSADGYDNVRYENFQKKSTPQKINDKLLIFTEELQIKPIKLIVCTEIPTETDEKWVKYGLRQLSEISLYSKAPLRIPAIQYIIENYFKTGQYSPIFMQWFSRFEGENQINLDEIFEKYEIERKEFQRIESCKYYKIVYFQREAGAPVLSFKYEGCQKRDEGEKCFHVLFVETNLDCK